MTRALTVFRRARAFFAPVERVTSAPTIFDPAQHAHFSLDAPPAPWLDLGWIENFRRASATANSTLRAGRKSAPAAQFRSQLDARVEFDFRTWGKLQMALSGGSQHMNVLLADVNAAPRPSGGSALLPAAVLPCSTAQEIVLGLGAVDAFSTGDLVAVDTDYLQQTGYVGTGIAAAYVNDPDDVLRDADYVRRVTFNVGRILQKTATSLILAQPLPGGAPAPGAAAQIVVAFVDREGGSFFQEWSGLFVFEDESGGRVILYYPRLRPAAPAAEDVWDLDDGAPVGRRPSADVAPTSRRRAAWSAKTVAPTSRQHAATMSSGELRGLALHAAFSAFPHTDVNDNEQVLCYRTFVTAPAASLY